MENLWSRWVQAPQGIGLRKAIFQVHLWTGIGLGAYVFVICVTGSVLVYRNELLRRLLAAARHRRQRGARP